jgi:hypothetical protein
MERICPLCNALDTVGRKCPYCGRRLEDGGALQNYLGPYSPYVEDSSVPDSMSGNYCIHLLYCPYCHYDTRAAWNFIEI